MFFKLVQRNSKRNRNDSLLYFSSMVISIIAFYIILSLSNQDVMQFLKVMESDAVNRLLTNVIPVFYMASLFVLFFLVYFASSIQMEKRRHEFGVYLSLGMRRKRLFFMLLLEDLRNNILALIVGLPSAILLSELISLITAKIVGLGIIGHQFSLSPSAALLTIIGFLLVKLIAFVFLSYRVTDKEIGELLNYAPAGMKKQLPKIVYLISMILGAVMLIKAYQYGAGGRAWYSIKTMGLTVFLGGVGTILLFFGLRIVIGFLSNAGGRSKKELHTFNFRQIQELVIRRSTSLAVCSLLMFSTLCLFGAGVAISIGATEHTHIFDYTFSNKYSGDSLRVEQVQKILKEGKIDHRFSELIEIRVGYPKEINSLSIDNLISQIEKAKYTEEREMLLRSLRVTYDCHFIALSGYNELRKVAKLEPIALSNGEAVLYMHKNFLKDEQLLNAIIKTRPTIKQAVDTLTLVGQVQSLPIVTDREITLGFALIVADSTFETYTQSRYSSYVSGILNPEYVKEVGLMKAIFQTNDILDTMPIDYGSYLQNMGRQLFYVVSASYITMYLAMIFLVVSNTTIGVQFLTGQRKTHKRYQTLVHLGATYESLCASARRQINWYFGLPVFIAIINSYFGIQSLFKGLLPADIKVNFGQQMLLAGVTVAVLTIFEYIYMSLVKKSSDKFLWTLMSPKRKE